MTEARYFKETPCPDCGASGIYGKHHVKDQPALICSGPGGSRREVTIEDMEQIVVASQIAEPVVAPDAWREAEGIAPVPDDAISSEEAVRRVRGGGPSTEGTKRP